MDEALKHRKFTLSQREAAVHELVAQMENQKSELQSGKDNSAEQRKALQEQMESSNEELRSGLDAMDARRVEIDQQIEALEQHKTELKLQLEEATQKLLQARAMQRDFMKQQVLN